MTIRIFSAIVISSACTCFGQKKIEFQLIASPTFSTRYLTSPDRDFVKDVNKVEKGMISYDIGILINPIKTPRFTIGSGLIFSRKGYVWNDKRGHDVFTGKPYHSKTSEIMNCLEVPLRATYALTETSTNYFIFGVSNDFLLCGKIKSTVDPLPSQPMNRRNYNLGLSLGFGHELEIRTLKLGLEPTLNFQTMNYISEDTPAKRFLLSMGLGFRYKFSI